MKKYLIPLFFLLLPVLAFAQTAAELEAILGTGELSCGQAARFVRASVRDGVASDSVSPYADFDEAMANRWFPKKTSANESITLGKLSFLMMRAFNIKGGMMYAAFPGPRYAFRSMVSHSYIQGVSDPAMKVSGERFLQILGRVLSSTGEEI